MTGVPDWASRIVQAIAAAHGGVATARNKPGGGAVVALHLPGAVGSNRGTPARHGVLVALIAAAVSDEPEDVKALIGLSRSVHRGSRSIESQAQRGIGETAMDADGGYRDGRVRLPEPAARPQPGAPGVAGTASGMPGGCRTGPQRR